MLNTKLNNKLKSLKFDNLEYGLNNLMKIVCKVGDGVSGKEARNAAKNTQVDLCLNETKMVQ